MLSIQDEKSSSRQIFWILELYSITSFFSSKNPAIIILFLIFIITHLVKLHESSTGNRIKIKFREIYSAKTSYGLDSTATILIQG